ncbi:MAG: MFS transporter [Sphingomonadales bacterium]|nr:MFS transporter [Sphingomonadales bacterium]MDE2570016.1 MFS transporter [Sphingomonadales bacterium]
MSTDTAFLRRDSAGLALVILTAISAIGFVDRIVLNVLVEPIRAEFGLDDTAMGLLSGFAFGLLHVVLGLFVARMAEKVRRLSLIALGTLLWSLATAGTGFATTVVQLFAARIAVGVGEAIGLPSSQSTISDFVKPARRATAMSILLLAPPIGAFLGAAGGSLVASIFGWRSVFLFAAVPGLVLAVLLHLLLAEPPRGRYDQGDVETVPPIRAVLARFVEVRTLFHIVAGSALASLAGYGINTFYAAMLMRRYGFTLLQAGLANGLVAAVPATISVMAGGMIADRLASRMPHSYARVPAVAMAVSPVLFIAGLWFENAWIALTLLSIAALFQFVYLGVTYGTVHNLIHPRMRVTSSAITNIIFSLIGGGLGPLLIGAASDWLGRHGFSPGAALASAMGGVSLFYLWSALHYHLAERTMDADLVAARAGFGAAPPSVGGEPH